MTSGRHLGGVAIDWGLLGSDEDGGLSMRVSHSSYLPYCCYLERRRGRVAEYAIRNLDGDPYASGERGLSGGAGTQSQVKLWVLVQIFSLTHDGKSNITRLDLSGMVRQFQQVER